MPDQLLHFSSHQCHSIVCACNPLAQAPETLLIIGLVKRMDSTGKKNKSSEEEGAAQKEWSEEWGRIGKETEAEGQRGSKGGGRTWHSESRSDGRGDWEWNERPEDQRLDLSA